MCTLANGYLGTRGAAPECRADQVHYPGTYLAGVYNRVHTSLNGRLVEDEHLVNAPNWLPLRFTLAEGGTGSHLARLRLSSTGKTWICGAGS